MVLLETHSTRWIQYNSVQFRRIAIQDGATSKWFCCFWFQTGQIHDKTETYTVLVSWDSPPRPKNSTSHLVKLKALGQAHYCIWPRKSIKECLLATSPAMVKLHGIWQMFHYYFQSIYLSFKWHDHLIPSSSGVQSCFDWQKHDDVE